MLTKFRGLSHREALIFRGAQRWAEFSPFLEYQDQEASAWLAAAISWANDPMPALYRESVGVNATLPAVPTDQILETLEKFGSFKTVKIKVCEKGEDLAQDLERVLFVAQHFPSATLRLDANGGYTVSQAMELATKLPLERIDYFEQPVASIAELSELKERLSQAGLGLKIAADESIRKTSDPLEVARAGAADVAVLKVQPLGGIDNALAIARESGLEVAVSSALETSIGLAQNLHLALALPSMNYDCGLGTLNLMAGDICAEPLIPKEGRLTARTMEPDLELLQKYAATPERSKWWLERLARCFELLES
jgi:O-succinylbenzoate synthase